MFHQISTDQRQSQRQFDNNSKFIFERLSGNGGKQKPAVFSSAELHAAVVFYLNFEK